jgi:signal transduction histidine kinase
MAEQAGASTIASRSLAALRNSSQSYLWRVAQITLAVAGAYFLSAALSFLFIYPNMRRLLWLPSVVLLIALLLTPKRTWWAFILALLLVHLLPVTSAQGSAPLAVLFYLGSVIESMGVTLFMQRFNGGIPRFDHLKSTFLFVIVAVLVAPAIGSALVVAAAALLGVGPGFNIQTNYGDIWQTRFLSYAASMIILLPPALTLCVTRGGVLRNVPRRRFAELGMIVLCFIITGVLMLIVEMPQLQNLSAFLFIPMLLLLWAGVRFGVNGVSFGLLLTAGLSLWTARFGHGAFSAGATTDNVLALRLLLIELGIPLMLMASLLAERRNTIRSLQASNRHVSQLAGQLISAQEEERRRIARELHDQVGQSLTTVKINLDTLRMGEQTPDTRELLEEGGRLVDGALEQVRDLSVLLRPAMLDDLGLEPALRSLLNAQAKRAGYQVVFHAQGLQPRPSRSVETICYRIAQEALTNVARHAQAKQVQLDVAVSDGRLKMTLRDDGIGFDVNAKQASAAAGKSMGLLSMTERARLGDGHLEMISAPGEGTTVRLDLPLIPAA